nr:DUF6884 domain-containing protein [Paracraurococcus ruber]
MKLHRAAPARDLYVSPWFRMARRYAETRGDIWFILSAEHGLVHPDKVLDPYDRTLLTMPVGARRAWATLVEAQMRDVLPACIPVIVVLAGARYREFLGEPLSRHADRVEVPMQGLGIGKQLGWLKHALAG